MLKVLECAPTCGFLVRSSDADEVVRAAKAHAKAAHDMVLAAADVRAMMRDIGTLVPDGPVLPAYAAEPAARSFE